MNITQDIHMHTHRSACGVDPAAYYIGSAQARGLDTIGFSEHMWENGKGYGIASYQRHEQNYGRVLQLREDLAACRIPNGLRVLVGCETDFVSDSTLGISREIAAELDYVIAPHSHTHFPEVMPPELRADLPAMAQFLYRSFVRLISHPDADLITTVAHPFATPLIADKNGDWQMLQNITDAQYREAFRRVADMGIGMEINSDAIYQSTVHSPNPSDLKSTEHFRMLSIAKDCGCKFTFGSDTHAVEAFQNFCYAKYMAEALGLTEQDVILL